MSIDYPKLLEGKVTSYPSKFCEKFDRVPREKVGWVRYHSGLAALWKEAEQWWEEVNVVILNPEATYTIHSFDS